MINKALISAVTAALLSSLSFPLSAEALEFDETFIYLELNSTDQDLGIHSKADGEAWQQLWIRGPADRHFQPLLNVWGRDGLRQQGLTELFFESDEPEIPADIDVATVLLRAPAGEYEFRARTLEHDDMRGEWTLSHVMAAPAEAELGTVAGEWVCAGVNPTTDLTVEWDTVSTAYDDEEVDPDGLLGDGAPLGGDDEVVLYTLVIERDEDEDAGLPLLVLSVDLPPEAAVGGTFSVDVPAAFFSYGGVYKWEIIVRTGSHNQTSAEGCITEADED